MRRGRFTRNASCAASQGKHDMTKFGRMTKPRRISRLVTDSNGNTDISCRGRNNSTQRRKEAEAQREEGETRITRMNTNSCKFVKFVSRLFPCVFASLRLCVQTALHQGA